MTLVVPPITQETVALCRKQAEQVHGMHFRRARPGKPALPYITHCERVADRMAVDDFIGQCVAWLHDYIEELYELHCLVECLEPNLQANWDEFVDAIVRQLNDDGVPAAVTAPVKIISKRPGKPYSEYLAEVRADDVYRRVKVADNQDNISDDPTDRQIIKYARSLIFLQTGKWVNVEE